MFFVLLNDDNEEIEFSFTFNEFMNIFSPVISNPNNKLLLYNSILFDVKLIEFSMWINLVA